MKKTLSERIASVAISVALLLPLPAAAQAWRSVSVSRALPDSTPLSLQVSFERGTLELRRSDDSALAMTLRYDAEQTRPRFAFDSLARSASFGAERIGKEVKFGRDEMGEAQLRLPAHIPSDLAVEVAAANSTLELGGLSLRKLNFRTGASRTTLRFGEPNRGSMAELFLDGSAGAVKATGLANARAARLNVQAHLGALELDFDGEWTSDLAADLRVVLSSVVIRVPRDVGLEFVISPVLSSFSQGEFTRSGDRYRTDNWDSASRKLSIRASSILASISVVRTLP
jgi:hypothetical protein